MNRGLEIQYTSLAVLAGGSSKAEGHELLIILLALDKFGGNPYIRLRSVTDWQYYWRLHVTRIVRIN